MNFESRFSIGDKVLYNGKPGSVSCVTFTDCGKVLYNVRREEEIAGKPETVTAVFVDSCDVEPA